jgi:uncharacterized protein (TIGR02271 family)
MNAPDPNRPAGTPRDARTPSQADSSSHEVHADRLGEAFERTVLTEAEERLRVGVREVETGRVRARRTVETFEETVEVPLARETVEVERVAVGEIVDEAPQPRREGDVLVVPVVEEVLVVERRLRLVEEVRIRQETREEVETQTHTLRRTRVETERLPAPDAPTG